MNTENWSCDDKLAELVALWNDLEQTTLLKRFAFGRALAELIDESLELTIEDVAERLRVGPRRLYVFVSVSKAISEDEVEAISSLVDDQGYSFTWTHLRSLARVEDRKLRRSLMKRWQKQSLCCTKFEELVRQQLSKPGDARSHNSGVSTILKKMKSISGVNKSLSELSLHVKDLELSSPNGRQAAVFFAEQIAAIYQTLRELRSALEIAAKEQGADLELPDLDTQVDDSEIDLLGEGDARPEQNGRPSSLSYVQPPVSRTGRRRKHGKPGSKAYDARVREKSSDSPEIDLDSSEIEE